MFNWHFVRLLGGGDQSLFVVVCPFCGDFSDFFRFFNAFFACGNNDSFIHSTTSQRYKFIFSIQGLPTKSKRRTFNLLFDSRRRQEEDGKLLIGHLKQENG